MADGSEVEDLEIRVQKDRGRMFRMETAAGIRMDFESGKASSIEELADNEGYDSLSAKVSQGIILIAPQDFQRSLALKEEEYALREPPEMINGRQTY